MAEGRFLRRRIAGAAVATLLLVPAVRAACTDAAAPGVDWRRCVQDGGEFAGKDLQGAALRDASFAFADLSGARLDKVEAYHAKFINAKLAGAGLDGANLGEADFTRADLRGASLRGADLTHAHFFHAVLRDTDLTGARLGGADLATADLGGALWTDGKRRCAADSLGQCN